MSHLFKLDSVKYVCCCGSLNPICFTYFCRHCLRLRCPYCVSHEVDSHYCGNCCENIPSAEAKLKRNKCGTCYDCPSCFQTLSIKASTIQSPVEGEPEKTVSKKSYYLTCGFCRWSSRDAGLPDSSASSGPWKEPNIKMDIQFGHLVGHFQMLGLREKCSKEKKYVNKNKFLAAGRHGVAHLLSKRFPTTNQEELSKEPEEPKYVASTKNLEGSESEIDQFFDENFDINNITTIEQRYGQVETQSREMKSLLPVHKRLLVKRSLRCRVCERNISKPEYSPASIKFKIQLNAYYHVPQVRLMAHLSQPLVKGQKRRITIRLANPTQFPTSVKFFPFSFLPLKPIEEKMVEESSTDDSLKSSTLAKEIHVLPIKKEEMGINVSLIPPSGELILPPRDETSDFDDFAETPDFNDDLEFIPWRKANKAAVYLNVQPMEEFVEGEKAILGLTIEYDYVNTIVAMENKSGGPQKMRIQAHVILHLDP